MTKEQLKNILIENKCIASGDWDNENPFVGIDLDALYDIFKKEKQQIIEKAVSWLNEIVDDDELKYVWFDKEEGQKGITQEFIDDFKKAMKGE